MLETFIELAEYVCDFYAPNSELYPIKGLHKSDIYEAFFTYKKRIIEAQSNNGRWFNVTYSWGGGDTLDRERVRDILLENPNLSWGS